MHIMHIATLLIKRLGKICLYRESTNAFENLSGSHPLIGSLKAIYSDSSTHTCTCNYCKLQPKNCRHTRTVMVRSKHKTLVVHVSVSHGYCGIPNCIEILLNDYTTDIPVQ